MTIAVDRGRQGSEFTLSLILSEPGDGVEWGFKEWNGVRSEVERG